MAMARVSRSGFSLVELSIVLVILGLLTGGILAGQSLIRAAELRSVSTDVQRYIAAQQSFRDKYFGLPGDITNATSFWGVANATPATCATTQGTGTQTCNGNGDGQILTRTFGAVSDEMFRYWQQLANAGLLEGSYTGVEGPGGAQHAVGGTNVPRSRLTNSIFMIRYVNDAAYYPASNGHNQLMFGTQNTAGFPGLSAIKPEEAWNIDTKMDDGKPGQGKVFSTSHTNTACATPANDPNASYALNLSANGCGLTFLGFD